MTPLLRFSFALVIGMVMLNTRASVTEPAQPGRASGHGYAFKLSNEGLLLDDRGTPVAVENVAGFLQALKVKQTSTIYLWIQGPDAVKNMGPTIERFDGQFSTIVMKQGEPDDNTGWVELAPDQKLRIVTMVDATSAGSEATKPQAVLTLKAGQTAILVAGQSIRFPARTTVCAPAGQNMMVQGNKNTINAVPGTIVAVALNATGESDNVVIAP
jgi:hypothetical protein